MDFSWFNRKRPKANAQALSIELARALGSAWWERALLVDSVWDERSGALLFADYWIAAPSHPKGGYPLRYDARQDDTRCVCLAGRANHACWHRGAVLLLAWELRRRHKRA